MGNLPHKIFIEPTTIRGERGQYYRVHFQDAVLIDETWNPEFEACRALLARGVTGPAEVWRYGKDHPDMLIRDIAKAAEWTVEENEKHGPRFVRWRPRPEGTSRKGSLWSAGVASEAEIDPGRLTIPQEETEPAE